MKQCSVADCGRKVHSLGLCVTHWRRHKRGLSLTAPIGPKNSDCLAYVNSILSEERDECLIWPFKKSSAPSITVDGRRMLATRYICTTLFGPPLEGQEAAHSCGKGHLSCINPKHLRWASHIENEADKIIHGTRPRGESHSSSKLTEADVLEIRRRISKGETRKALALELGVSRTLVSLIGSGKRWVHI